MAIATLRVTDKNGNVINRITGKPEQVNRFANWITGDCYWFNFEIGNKTISIRYLHETN